MRRGDDSSIDSLEVSPPPRKDQISLSRDSGLTLSDSQLYTPDEEEESGSTSSSGYDPAFDPHTKVTAPTVSMPGEYVRVYPGWEERKNVNFQRQAWFRQRSKRLGSSTAAAAANKEAAVRRTASEESVLDNCGNVPPPTPPRRNKPQQGMAAAVVQPSPNNNRISLPPDYHRNHHRGHHVDYYNVVVSNGNNGGCKSEVIVESLQRPLSNYGAELTIKPVFKDVAVQDTAVAVTTTPLTTVTTNCCNVVNAPPPVRRPAIEPPVTTDRRYRQQPEDHNRCQEEEDSSTLSDEDCTPHVSRSNSRGNEVAAESVKLRHQPASSTPPVHVDGTVRLRGRLKRREEKAVQAAVRSRSLPPPPPYRPPPPANRRAPITSYYLGDCSQQSTAQHFVVTRNYADEESYV